jgi:dTMP kinase
MRKSGIFVTFEGIEGSGKSTQARLLYQRLLDSKTDVLLTREPGGTELGANIRKMILESGKVYPAAELLLFLADRNQHINEVILPALDRGATVICDRYYHSTYAYQGDARNMDWNTVKLLNDFAIEGLKPDLTFLIDIPVEVGFERKKTNDLGLDRIEKEDVSFHNTVRKAYLKLGKEEKMIVVIDGSKNEDEIRKEVIGVFKNKFPKVLSV